VLPPTVGEATVPGLLVVGVTPAMELPVEAAPGKVVSVGDVASLGPIGDDTGVAEQVSSRVQSVVVGAIEESEPDWAWESVINREERRRGRVKGSNNIFFPGPKSRGVSYLSPRGRLRDVVVIQAAHHDVMCTSSAR